MQLSKSRQVMTISFTIQFTFRGIICAESFTFLTSQRQMQFSEYKWKLFLYPTLPVVVLFLKHNEPVQPEIIGFKLKNRVTIRN